MSHHERELRSNGRPLDGSSLDAAQAWVDGELGATDAAAFARELQDSEGLQDAVARAKAMRTLFAELPRFAAPPAIREDLRDRMREGHDRVAREIRALPRFNAPSPVRDGVMRHVREAAAVVRAERIAAGEGAGAHTVPFESWTGAILRDRARVRVLPLRFLVAASVLIAASATLLAGGRRMPVRPAGALPVYVEFAQAKRVSISAAFVADRNGRSQVHATIGGSR